MSDRCPIYAAQEITIRAAIESRRLLEAFEGKMASRGFMLGKAKTDRDSNE